MKKISIIVPVCNTGDFIANTLDNLLRQTLKDIEIICVDDASDDNSAEILKEYEQKYDNITCIYYKERKSAAQARKDAVLLSTGKYIMFVDSDDFIEDNGCEIAYKAIEKKKTDIVQFRSVVENFGNLPEERIASNQKALEPYLKDYIYGDILKASFVTNLFSFTLWNKIYNGDMVREAMAKVKDGFFPKANDLYAAFYILDGAKSYVGIEDTIYHYCFGRGMTGHNIMEMSDYEKCCASSKVYFAISEYVESLEFEKNRYTVVLNSIEQRLINEQLSKWNNNVSKYVKIEALNHWQEVWSQKYTKLELFSIIANKLWNERTKNFEYIKEILNIKPAKRPIKTVALYYRSIVNGGAQRVVAELCNILSKKYKVVLVTDDKMQENEYYVNEKVSRYFIPSFESSIKNYGKRAEALWKLIDDYEIDAFVNSLWLQDCASIDALCIKSHPRNPAFLTHCHSFCAVTWKIKRNVVEEYWKYYTIADGIITLSKVDQQYWSGVNKRVYYIPNPCLDNRTNAKVKFNKGTKKVLWVGRISSEKQPTEAIEIAKFIKEYEIDAKVYIVGDGDANLLKSIKTEIQDYELDNYVSLEGFHLNLEKYYKEADFLISTSEYEGFPLTPFEAASYGIPTITYDLPWIEYYNIIDGWDRVPQGDAREAALIIGELSKDKKRWEEKSEKLYKSFKKYRDLDILDIWSKVFDDVENGNYPKIIPTKENTAILTRELIEFHTKLIEETQAEIKDINAKKKKLNDRLGWFIKELLRVKKSETFKAGKIVTYPFRKAKKYTKKALKALYKFFVITLPNKITNRPAISIIMPVYNGEEYLYESLGSLRKQTLKNIEVICVDDESTDASCQIIESIAAQDPRFKLLKQKHSNAGNARNLGIKEAKGEFLLFLDSDDTFDKNLCKKTYEKAKIRNAEIVVFNSQKKDVKKDAIVSKEQVEKYIKPLNKAFNPVNEADKIFQFTSACPWTKLFKRSFVEKNKLEYHNTSNSNDVYFTRTALVTAKRIVAIKDILVTYNYNRDDSLQGRKDLEPLAFFNEYKAVKQYLLDKGLYETYEYSFKLALMEESLWNYNTMRTLEAKSKIRKTIKKEKAEDFEIENIEEADDKAKEIYENFHKLFRE